MLIFFLGVLKPFLKVFNPLILVSSKILLGLNLSGLVCIVCSQNAQQESGCNVCACNVRACSVRTRNSGVCSVCVCSACSVCVRALCH